MPLLNSCFQTLAWHYRVLKAFLKAQFVITSMVVLFQALSKITYLLAFLLPLKVILLIGTPGVPRYFPFVDPAHKMDWVLGLTLAAIGCYLLTLLFDNLTERLAVPGSKAVVARANKIVAIRNQETSAQSYYLKFTDMAANLLFITLGLLLLFFFNIPVFTFILGFSLTAFIFTAILLWTAKTQITTAVSSNHPVGYVPSYFVGQNAIQNWMVKRARSYNSIVSSVAFLLGFLLILYPYLDGEGPNILISLISFLVLRQIASFAESNINASLSLNKHAEKINALVFKSQQTALKEKKHKGLMRDLFRKKKRNRIARSQLNLQKGEQVNVSWLDSNITGITQLKIDRVTHNQTHHYQQQIFNTQTRHLLDKEAFLFSYIPREKLKAPPLVKQFKIHDFDCQIVDYGSACPLDRKAFKQSLDQLNEQVFQRLVPPKSLVKDYKQTRPLLHNRLTLELVKRLDVAIDTEHEKNLYNQLINTLEQIIQSLSKQPLYIYNPECKAGNLVWQNSAQNDPTQIYIMTWGRWSLEPIGISFDPNQPDSWFEQKADWLKAQRKDINPNYAADDIKLVMLTHKMIQALQTSQFKRAFYWAEQIQQLDQINPHKII